MSSDPHHRHRKHRPPAHLHSSTGAPGERFSRPPVNALGAPPPISPTAKFHGDPPRKLILATATDLDKITLAAKLAISKLPENLRETASAILTPENLRTMAALAAAWAAAHLIGVGEAFDVVMLGWGVWTFGPQVFEAATDPYEFITTATHATTDEDIERAASHLAHFILVFGAVALTLLLHKVVKSFRRTGAGVAEGDSEAATPEKAESTETKPEARSSKEPVPKSVAEKLDSMAGVDRVRYGSNDKVALIGRGMDKVVNPFKDGAGSEFNPETFEPSNAAKEEWKMLSRDYGGNIPPDKVVDTLGYKENQAWAQKLVDQNYTVADLDNPTGAPASPFYNMEKQTIFGDAP